MRAILPIAGKGVRLLPHTAKRQKVLLPVAGKAMLDYSIDPLIEAGVTEICLVVGHLGDQVHEHIARYSKVELTVVEQEQQLGLGHAVFLGLKDTDDPTVIVLADTIFQLDFSTFVHGHGNQIAVVEVDDPSRFGIVEVEDNRIVDMVEKPSEPPSNLAIAGLYRVENQRRLRESLIQMMEMDRRTKDEFQLTDALKIMLDGGEVFRSYSIEGWLDCGTAETLLATNRYLLEQQGASYVHPEAKVVDTQVRASTIMERCFVRDSVLSNCLVLPGARVVNCRIQNTIVEADASLEGYRSGH